MERQSAVLLCLRVRWMANFGSAPTTQRMSTRICRKIRRLRSLYPAQLMHGKAVFEENMQAKEMCIANPIVKSQYGTADNPIFEVFYLEDAHGVIADFSGNPPYEF